MTKTTITVDEGTYGVIHGIEVQVTRNIRIGAQYSISPTMGMLGIEDGTVEVVNLLSWPKLQLQSYWSELADPEQLVELDSTLTDEYWVVYKYRNRRDMDDTLFAIPLSMFVDHTSSWY